jgi:hypothetical protein
MEEKQQHVTPLSELQLLHSTGVAPLVLRIVSLPFLIFCSWVLIGIVWLIDTEAADKAGVNPFTAEQQP